MICYHFSGFARTCRQCWFPGGTLARLALVSALAIAPCLTTAQTAPVRAAAPTFLTSEQASTELGAVLNASWQSIPQALSHRDKGWGLGHSDISLDATLSPALLAKFSAVAHSDHHREIGRAHV